MDIVFLGQGLNPEVNNQTGQEIKRALLSGQYFDLKIFVAFISRSGLNSISNELNTFISAGNSVKIYAGVDLHGTSKEALEMLIQRNIETYIVYSPNSLIYHPKIYLFEGRDNSMVILGSSNLTTTGLFQNVEASICIKIIADDIAGKTFLDELLQHYNGIINATHQSCKQLTIDILKLLEDNKIVLPETLLTRKRNQSNREYSKRDAIKNAQLFSTFGKIKEIRPPSGFTRNVVQEIHETISDSETSVVLEEISLEGGSLWVETRAMTGAARNILDLSMSGVSPTGEVIRGSLDFFDINVNDRDRETNIIIVHGGKNYSGNTIKFPKGERANMTWRLQLKGITTDGETLTNISRPILNNEFPGGFVNKLLLFKRISNGVFDMAILSTDLIDNLKEKSEVWGTNGNSNGSKAYGFIAS